MNNDEMGRNKVSDRRRFLNMDNQFIIEDSFWSLFPHAKIGVVIAKNINNHREDAMNYKSLLMMGANEGAYHLLEENFTDNPVIASWRQAYQAFKTKKGARSSIESMLKRVDTGKGLGSINPLVDIYNLISLKYGMPCGGEDSDSFVGKVRLTKAVGDEAFIVLGSEESAPPKAGEIVYKDDAGAICRSWNWRESARSMLTEETKNAFLCIELIQEEELVLFHQALLELKKLVEAYLGGRAEIHILDINKKNIEF